MARSLSFPAPARLTGRAVALAGVVITLLILAIAPACAAVTDPHPRSLITVSQVTVADGRASITAHLHVVGNWVTGFQLILPDRGRWWGSGDGSDFPVPALGLGCRSAGTYYTCLRNQAAQPQSPYLSPGYYDVTLPETHTGPLPAGLAGYVSLAGWAPADDSRDWDEFPVVDGSHFQTTAEVRMAPLTPHLTSPLSGVTTIPLSLVVAPGERLAAVDVLLPAEAHWALTGSNTLPQGIWCSVRPTITGGSQLHCAGRFAEPVPAGHYELVSTMRYYGGHSIDGDTARVTVTMVDGVAELMDYFFLRLPPSP